MHGAAVWRARSPAVASAPAKRSPSSRRTCRRCSSAISVCRWPVPSSTPSISASMRKRSRSFCSMARQAPSSLIPSSPRSPSGRSRCWKAGLSWLTSSIATSEAANGSASSAMTNCSTKGIPIYLGGSGRRMAGHLSQLYFRHHRQPEGRRLPPSRRLPERHLQHLDLEHVPTSRLPVDAADVPLQRLVLPLDGCGRRRHQCLPAPRTRRYGLRGHQDREGEPLLRGADRPQHARQCASGAEGRYCAPGQGDDSRRRAAAPP